MAVDIEQIFPARGAVSDVRQPFDITTPLSQ
jgi:hypothetical protein